MRIALLGYGKMGKTIEKLAQLAGDSVVYTKSSEEEQGQLSDADAAIEFSTPETAVENIIRCFETGIPVVSGTTGWLTKYDEVLKKCEERNGSFIYASNFSVGVNLFFKLNHQLAELMKSYPEYKVSMEEIHHTEKKDAPSGTAITLATQISEIKKMNGWTLDQNDPEKVKISAVRKEEVKGTHEVSYASTIDTISIKHEAHTREGFAKGALLAAAWLKNKNGVYTMADVLDLKS